MCLILEKVGKQQKALAGDNLLATLLTIFLMLTNCLKKKKHPFRKIKIFYLNNLGKIEDQMVFKAAITNKNVQTETIRIAATFFLTL